MGVKLNGDVDESAVATSGPPDDEQRDGFNELDDPNRGSDVGDEDPKTEPENEAELDGTVGTETTKPEPTGPDNYTRREQAHYQAILDHWKEVGRLEDKWKTVKEKTSFAKKAWETAVEAHGELVNEDAQQLKLLFGEDGNDPPADNKPNQPDESWREMSIAELDLKQSVVAKLADADMDTLSDLSDWMAAEGEQWWQSLAGIGETTAMKISDAFAAFWKNHPEFCDGGNSTNEDDQDGTDGEETEDENENEGDGED